MDEKKPIGLIFADIYKENKSGVLHVARGEKFKVFYVNGREIVDVLSNIQGESLEEFLLRRGSIPKNFIEKAAKEGKKLEEYILEKGLLIRTELEILKNTRILETVKETFEWGTTEFVFEEGPVEGNGTGILEAIRYSLNRLNNRNFYRDYIESLDVILKATETEFKGLKSEEIIVLEDFRQARKIRKVLAESPLGEFKALKIVVFLYLMGLLKEAPREEEYEEIEIVGTVKENALKRKGLLWVFLLLLIASIAIFAGALFYFGYPGILKDYFNEKIKGSPVRKTEIVKPRPIKIPEKPEGEKIAETSRRMTIEQAIKKENFAPQRKEDKKDEITKKDIESRKDKQGKEISSKKALEPAKIIKTPSKKLFDDPFVLLKNGKIHEASKVWYKRYKNERGFTLLLELDCLPESVKWAFRSSDRRLFIIPYMWQGRLCYRVCFGVFNNQAEAVSARKYLPRNFRSSVVYPIERVISEAPLPEKQGG